MAALLLVALGIPICVLGFFATLAVSSSIGEHGLGVLVLGLPVLVIGILYLLTAVGVWRHQTWGLALGLFFGVVGALPGLLLLDLAAFDPGSDFSPVNEQNAGAFFYALGWALMTAIVPQTLVVVGLVLGLRHFQRQG